MKKTDTAFYDGHQGWYVGGFLVSVGVLAWATWLAHYKTMTGWEIRVFRHLNNWSDHWHTFFKLASVAHESTWIAVAAVVLACVFKFWRLAWRLAVCVFGGYAVAFLLKHFIARPRPFDLLSGVHVRWSDSGSGFPSGHATIITVVMMCILPYLPKWLRWIVPVAIVLVAWSRMYLGLHAPLDVIGGFAVGLGVVSFVRILPQSIKVALRLD